MVPIPFESDPVETGSKIHVKLQKFHDLQDNQNAMIFQKVSIFRLCSSFYDEYINDCCCIYLPKNLNQYPIGYWNTIKIQNSQLCKILQRYKSIWHIKPART